jgi:hypothetical protein
MLKKRITILSAAASVFIALLNILSFLFSYHYHALSPFPVYAQESGGLITDDTSSDNSFLTYEHSVEGFKIEYPCSWTKLGYGPIIFFPPEEGDEDINCSENIEQQEQEEEDRTDSCSGKRLLPESPPRTRTKEFEVFVKCSPVYKDMPLKEIFTFENDDPMLSADIEVLDSKPITLKGSNNMPAYMTEYTDANGAIRGMDVHTVSGNKLYELSYKAELSEFSSFLPIVQRMIDSFQIIPVEGVANNNNDGIDATTTITATRTAMTTIQEEQQQEQLSLMHQATPINTLGGGEQEQGSLSHQKYGLMLHHLKHYQIYKK